ncbi:phenylacetate--CoA ligase family protein [Endomicrobium proavitum]|uniref:Phenylacetate-coenzyme A ligase n=1 Tax=Endomicrobium proavitum TaxID=1408281 RepID=A0A0G3WIN2_9BACT|nr:phenylacetate--CoA ligase [Endomicrobium proavitum]AKL98496.1 Phenylacetate-coenzyme A ligase [Endomicrobium proavitum]
MIFNEKYEIMPLQDLKNLQSERLANLVKYVYKNSPVYKKRIDESGFSPSSIKTIDDITKLPFTTKDDMRDFYPFGLFSLPIEKIAEVHVSSGTTGNPVVSGYSKEDVDLWAEAAARSIGAAGGNPGDIIQIAYGYGLFTGGLGLHYGALKFGCPIMPMSSGQTKRQVKLMQDFKPRILACTPSFALYMAEEAHNLGVKVEDVSWDIGIFGAEPWTTAIRDEIDKSLGMLATDIYGLSEISGPGVAQECHLRDGLHFWSDVFYPEIIDPKTNKPCKEGEIGELVITTFTRTGMPLLRYRTRDLVSINNEVCACGRTAPRISKIKGRTDDMIVVRGINVFPTQIEYALLQVEESLPNYQIIVDRAEHGLDKIEVQVEIAQKYFTDELKGIEAVRNKIKKSIEQTILVGVDVKLVEPKTITRSEGKAKRVIDNRKL